MTRMTRTALGICLLGVLWVSPPGPETARSAPALKDRRGLTKEAREALQKRVTALGHQLQGAFERVKIGKDSLADYLNVIRGFCDAQVALADTRVAERAVLENVLRQLVVIEEQLTELHKVGLQPYDGILQSRAVREKVQFELEKRHGGR